MLAALYISELGSWRVTFGSFKIRIRGRTEVHSPYGWEWIWTERPFWILSDSAIDGHPRDKGRNSDGHLDAVRRAHADLTSHEALQQVNVERDQALFAWLAGGTGCGRTEKTPKQIASSGIPLTDAESDR
jgi:hypothetical protein